MKTLKLTILQKNRKYFACKLNGYNAKLVIDQKSDSLEIGEHELLVNDLSVRTKYGTDLIFEVAHEIKKEEKNSITSLKHRYNTILIERCKNLGGKFDDESKSWIFNSVVFDEVEKIDETFNSDTVTVEITALAKQNELREAVQFCGYPIAQAFGRDSGAKICTDVYMISGKLYSGGSQKNWYSCIEGGSVFRLNISKNLLQELKETYDENWAIKILE